MFSLCPAIQISGESCPISGFFRDQANSRGVAATTFSARRSTKVFASLFHKPSAIFPLNEGASKKNWQPLNLVSLFGYIPHEEAPTKGTRSTDPADASAWLVSSKR